MTVEANISIIDNTDWSIPLTFTDEDENTYDFTGSTFRLDVKVKAEDVSAVASLTSGAGIVHTDLANASIHLEFGDFTIAVGSYVYDLIRISGALRETLMIGQMTVARGITGL